MASRKVERKPKKNEVKRKPRKSVSRKSVRKEKLKPIRKAQEANATKVLESKKQQRAIELAATALKQLKAHIDIVLEANKTAKKPIDFLRVWNSLQMTNSIYCSDMHAWRDLVVCQYVCQSKCHNFTSRRYLCKLMRCNEERRQKCEETDARCYAFKLVEPYVERYTRAYFPVWEINKEVEGIKEELRSLPKPKKKDYNMGQKGILKEIKKSRERKPQRKPKTRKAMKNASD